MAVIALTSASGSPGVSTTAAGLALSWHRPCLLVEADPTGGSPVLAGYLHGRADRPAGGLLDLALAYRNGTLPQALPTATMPISGQARLLPGIRSHTQAGSLRGLWEPLTGALAGLERTGQDVIMDVGRLGLAGSAEPVLHHADVTVVLTRSSLPALAAARSWVATLRERFDTVGALDRLVVVVVGQGDPYTRREVSKVLRTPVPACLPWDPDTARVFSHGDTPARKFARAPLTRSLQAAAAVLDTHVRTVRDSLSTGTPIERAAP